MGKHRPIPTKCWINFLLSIGYKSVRTSSSHHQYTKSGKRTIPVWGNEKEIPALHIKTSCRSIGISVDEFLSWADKNC